MDIEYSVVMAWEWQVRGEGVNGGRRGETRDIFNTLKNKGKLKNKN